MSESAEWLAKTIVRLVVRGLPTDAGSALWQAAGYDMAKALDAASDDALVEFGRLWIAREESADALGRNVAQEPQNRDLTASEVESGLGDHRDDEGRSGAQDGNGS